MEKKPIISATIAAALFPVALYAQKGNAYQLQGKLENKDSARKVYLYYMSGGQQKKDSATVGKGVFSFRGTLEEPAPATLVLAHDEKAPGRDHLSLYLEKGIIRVTGKDSIYSATVKGGKVNEEYTWFKNEMAGFDRKEKEARAASKAGGAGKEQAGKELEELEAARKTAIIAFVKAHPGSPVSLSAIERIGGFEPDVNEVGPLYDGLSAAVRNTPQGVQYGKKIAVLRKTDIGQIAPSFELTGMNGSPIKLDDFKGKYVLLDFWASWCKPCRAENPHLVKAYNRFKDQNFTIFGVTLDNPSLKQAWLKAIEQDGLPWTHAGDFAHSQNQVADEYGIQFIPQNFLLDPDGKILAKNLRGEDLEKELEKILVH